MCSDEFLFRLPGDYIPQWSCDFEDGLCHWLQVKDDRLDFKYVMGSDVGWKDHTTKSSNGMASVHLLL